MMQEYKENIFWVLAGIAMAILLFAAANFSTKIEQKKRKQCYVEIAKECKKENKTALECRSFAKHLCN